MYMDFEFSKTQNFIDIFQALPGFFIHAYACVCISIPIRTHLHVRVRVCVLCVYAYVYVYVYVHGIKFPRHKSLGLFSIPAFLFEQIHHADS